MNRGLTGASPVDHPELQAGRIAAIAVVSKATELFTPQGFESLSACCMLAVITGVVPSLQSPGSGFDSRHSLVIGV